MFDYFDFLELFKNVPYLRLTRYNQYCKESENFAYEAHLVALDTLYTHVWQKIVKMAILAFLQNRLNSVEKSIIVQILTVL